MAKSGTLHGNGQFRLADVFSRFAPLIFILVLMIGFTIGNPRFISIRNILNIITEVSIYGLMAIGMTFVILTAGIDLSVGAILALSGMVSAVILSGGTGRAGGAIMTGMGWPPAMLAALFIGSICGWIQGLAVTRLKVPPFVVTLGGMTAFRGAALVISNGQPITGLYDEAFRWWGRGTILGIPVPGILFIVASAIVYLVLRHTRYGRKVYSVGDNPEAARLAGLNVNSIVTSVYVIIGFMCGLSGFVQSARLTAAQAVAGLGFELRVIASVVIGGTSLSGGSGGIVGTIMGTILIGVLYNGLVLMNVSAFWQMIIIGIIIVLAVAFDIRAKSS